MHLLQRPLEDRRPPLARLIGNARAIVLSLVLISSLGTLNALQMLSPVLLPFSRRRFRIFNRFIAGQWCRLSTWIFETICGFRLRIEGDPIPEDEDALLIANHQEMPDIILLLILGSKTKRSADFKWFAKNALKFVPGIGWGMLFLDCIFLKRNWAEDRGLIHKSFAKYHEQQIPFWLVLFPEGTRLRAHKLEAAQQIARTRGFPVPEHVLLPRPRGFAAALAGLRPRARAVYDITIAYEGGMPTLFQLLNGAASGAWLTLRRFPVEMIPTEERPIAEWLRARFIEKDELLSSRFKTMSQTGQRIGTS